MSVLVISLLLRDPFPVFLCPVWWHRELHFPGSLTYWLRDGFSQSEALEEVECRRRGKARILLPLLCFQPGLCSIRVSSLAPSEEPPSCTARLPLAGPQPVQLLSGDLSSWASGTLPALSSPRNVVASCCC